MNRDAAVFLPCGIELFAVSCRGDLPGLLAKSFGKRYAKDILAAAVMLVADPELDIATVHARFPSSWMGLLHEEHHTNRRQVTEFLRRIGRNTQGLESFFRARYESFAGSLLASELRVSQNRESRFAIENIGTDNSNRTGGTLLFTVDADTLEPVCFASVFARKSTNEDYERLCAMTGTDECIVVESAGHHPLSAPGGYRILNHVREVAMLSGRMAKVSDAPAVTAKHGAAGVPVTVRSTPHNGKRVLHLLDNPSWVKRDSDAYLLAHCVSGTFDGDAYAVARENFGKRLLESRKPVKAEDIAASLMIPELPMAVLQRSFVNLENSEDPDLCKGIHLVRFVAAILTARMLDAAKSCGILQQMTFGNLLRKLRQTARIPGETTPAAGDGWWNPTDTEGVRLLVWLGVVEKTKDAA